MKYNIEIKETLSRVIKVEAETEEDAMSQVENQYYTEIFVLNIDDFENVTFKNLDSKQEDFVITSICRDDLTSEGYYTDNISDATMNRIADKIADGIMDSFWEILHGYCKSNNIKTKEDICEEAIKIMQEKYPDVELEYVYNNDQVFYLKDQYQDEYNTIVDNLENEYLSKEI